MASSLVIRIGADLSALAQSLKKAENQLKRFSFKAERIGRDLTTRVSLPILAIGGAAVKTFADFDKLEKGLAAVSGSAEEGTRQFKSLLNIVKDTQTTLDLKSAAAGSLQLQAVGVSAANAERLLRQLGRAATLTGNSAQDVGEVGRQLAQSAAKGKILQQELRIILERLPGLAAVVKQEFGTVTAEGINAAGVSAQEFIERLTTAAETSKTFQNIQGGLGKAFETFGIELQIAAREVGKTIAETLNLEVNLKRLSDTLSTVAEGFANLSPTAKKFVVFAASAVAAIGPLFLGLGAVARALPLLRSGFAALIAPAGAAISSLIAFTRASIATTVALSGTGSIAQLRVLASVLAPIKGAAASARAGMLALNASIAASKGSLLLFADNARFAFAAFSSAGPAGKARFVVLSFVSVLNKLRIAMVTALGPVTIVIAAVALLVAGFVKAYKNSAFFRQQLARLEQAFRPIITAVKDLANKILPDLSISFESVGNAFNFVFALIAGGISFVIEGIIAVIDTVKNTAGAIIDFFSGDFSAAGEKLSKTLFNPSTFTATAGRAAEAAVKVFNETLEGAPIEVQSFAVPTEPGVDPKPPGGGGQSTPDAVQAIQPGQIDGVNVLSLALQQVARDTEFIQGKIDALRPTIQEDIFAPYREGLETITEKQLAFGDTYDGLSEKINLTKSTIASLIEEGYTVQSGAVELLIEQLGGLTAQQDAVTESITAMKAVMEQLQAVAGTAFGAVTQAMSRGASAAQAFGQAVVSAIRDAIAAKIKLAVTEAAASVFANVPFPLSVGLAAAAGAGASGIFNSLLNTLKIPLLADGGITQGAGLFVAGEAGPEAIIPLDRLNEFMRPSGGQVSGVLRADGNELIAVIDTVQQQNARSF